MKIASTVVQLGLSPFPVIVTNRIITFLVGDPNLNLHLPLLLARGTTQNTAILEYIHIYFNVWSNSLFFQIFFMMYMYIYIYIYYCRNYTISNWPSKTKHQIDGKQQLWSKQSRSAMVAHCCPYAAASFNESARASSMSQILKILKPKTPYTLGIGHV